MWNDELDHLLPLQRLRVLHLDPLGDCSSSRLAELGRQLPLLRQLRIE